MDDWIMLTYKLHGDLENMLVPEFERNRDPQPRWNWVFYTTYCLYKFIQWNYK